MKTHTIAFSAASVLFISLIAISLFKIGLAAALTDATSTVTTDTSTSTPVSTSTTITTTPPSTSPGTPTAQPTSLNLVRVVGTKYIDYFTDGTKTYSFPGAPAVDSNLNKPNAPIPSHSGLKWVSTSGMEAYDTSSGDLELGDYAQEVDGSYISNVPAYTYTDATSSVPVAAHIAMSKTDPTRAAVTTPAMAPATTQSTSVPATSTTAAPAAPVSAGTSTATSTAQ